MQAVGEHREHRERDLYDVYQLTDWIYRLVVRASLASQSSNSSLGCRTAALEAKRSWCALRNRELPNEATKSFVFIFGYEDGGSAEVRWGAKSLEERGDEEQACHWDLGWDEIWVVFQLGRCHFLFFHAATIIANCPESRARVDAGKARPEDCIVPGEAGFDRT